MVRGFPDMASRPDPLAAFYGGPVWHAHREAANATMIDSDCFGPPLPLLDKAGARALARLRTEYADNNFPALPVRAGEHVFVWFASFASQDDYRDHAHLLDHPLPSTRQERLMLATTPRSLVR